MSLLAKKKVEQVVKISNIDPVTCKSLLKGEVDEDGSCLVRIKYDPSKPSEVELERIEYVPPSPVVPAPPKKEGTL